MTTTLADEAKALIHRRQKLIKIADRNKDGWRVVEEYESDDLASNSEDEKRLRKAIKSAGRKRKVESKEVDEKSKRSKSDGSEQQFFRGKL